MWCDVWRVMFLSPLWNLDILLLILKLIIDHYSFGCHIYIDIYIWCYQLNDTIVDIFGLHLLKRERVACCLNNSSRQNRLCQIGEKRSTESDVNVINWRKTKIANYSLINQLQVMRINTVQASDVQAIPLYRGRMNIKKVI